MAPLLDAERVNVTSYQSRACLDPSVARVFACIVVAAMATGCGGETTSQGSVARYPTGLATDAPSLSTTVGVYPASSDDNTCCWLDRDARFYVPGDASATSVTIQVYVPAVGPLATNPGSVSTIDERGKTITTKALKNGVQTFSLSLPPKSSSHDEVTVRLRMSTAFVPKDLGLNGDIRRLSIVLMSAKPSNPPS